MSEISGSENAVVVFMVQLLPVCLSAFCVGVRLRARPS